ncbi:MAG: hypothetical protein K2N89_06890 [Lachnospiraceae bacterium]|nr:hypothetical protein [Lachnospiraceae bacterium]
MAIKIGGNAYNVNISSEISRESARCFYEQKLNKADNAQNVFKQQVGFDPKKNRAEIENRLKHTVCRSVTKLSDTMADILKGIREEKGAYEYKDVINAAGSAYAKLYAEIEKRYEDPTVYYFKPDGTSATMEEEIAWLDEEYEAKIALEKSSAKIAALREKFLGNIAEIPTKEIEKIADDFYEARYKALFMGQKQ